MTDPETDQISAKTKISMGGVITAAAKAVL